MDDERYYFSCPMRKNRARIPVTVCHQKKCLFLASEDGKLRCGYGDQRFKIGPPTLKLWRAGKRPRVSRVDRDGLS
jgi:hypothetical protein